MMINNSNNIYTLKEIILSCILIYISLWLLQFLLYFILKLIGGEIWNNKKNCDIIARLSVDTISMIICCILGYEGFISLGGFQSLTIGNAYERLYLFNSDAQRLLLFQMGYTFKTVGDAIIYNDGIISLVHHIATGVVVALAFHPFLHTYAVFYVGLSEISTVPLCIVIALQNDRGVPLLKQKYPTFDTFIGILFSISFLFCRIILWGFYSFYFWQDLLEVLLNNTAHSSGIVIWYLIANAGLSILQVYWLSTILKAVFELFGPSTSKKAN